MVVLPTFTLHMAFFGWHYGIPRNGRVAHQPVNGTIPSELVQLFCKIVNGVLRIFGRDGKSSRQNTQHYFRVDIVAPKNTKMEQIL